MTGESIMKIVDIIIRGEHNTGRTTLASLIREFLAENGYKHVTPNDWIGGLGALDIPESKEFGK